ncbi:MAG TPA: gamma-glutamylcyclotransferase [Stellaceae bacterium]|nr:gamma-glutamylcyclotransferase [Stellaceae bacterium]
MSIAAADRAPPMPAAITAWRDSMKPPWLFAYGSLLWDQEFAHLPAEAALLRGYHRSFCLYSYDYRGTPGRPGLTLGLDRGGSCRGMVFRLSAEAVDRVWQREMSGRPVYEARLPVVRTGGGLLTALAFTVLRGCPDYAGELALDDAARLILTATGRRGTCREYFESTLCRLCQYGFLDSSLRRLAERVAALAVSDAADVGV